MSRSYKKTPICKELNSQFGKRQANKAVRRNNEIADGGAFKKVYCSWNISDYKMIQTEKELKQDWDNGAEYLHRRFATYEQALFDWKKANVLK